MKIKLQTPELVNLLAQIQINHKKAIHKSTERSNETNNTWNQWVGGEHFYYSNQNLYQLTKLILAVYVRLLTKHLYYTNQLTLKYRSIWKNKD